MCGKTDMSCDLILVLVSDMNCTHPHKCSLTNFHVDLSGWLKRNEKCERASKSVRTYEPKRKPGWKNLMDHDGCALHWAIFSTQTNRAVGLMTWKAFLSLSVSLTLTYPGRCKHPTPNIQWAWKSGACCRKIHTKISSNIQRSEFKMKGKGESPPDEVFTKENCYEAAA